METCVSDTDLMVALAKGDNGSLVGLYERYQRLVFGLAYRITQDHTTAEEVVQDTFYTLWHSATRYDPARAPIGWIVRIAENRAIDATRSRCYRSRQREYQLAILSPQRLSFSDPECDLFETLHWAFARLSRKQQHYLLLAFKEELSHAEIAQRLDEPIGTVKTRIRSGLRQMRRLLVAREEYAHGGTIHEMRLPYQGDPC